MRKFMTLIDIEMNRIFKVFLPALLIYIILGVGNSIIKANNIMNSYKDKAKIAGQSVEEYFKKVPYDQVTIKSVCYDNYVINYGIALVIFGVLAYSLMIWYREWFGNNKTIYTLLVLPFNRTKIYAAKFITIIAMLLCSISAFMFTLIGFYVVNKKIIIQQAIAPYKLKDVIGENGIYSKGLSLNGLLVITALAIISFLFFFCAMERSFRIKGLILGLILGGVILGVTILIFTQKNLYYIEKKWMISGFYFITMIGTIVYCNYLLKNKVAV
ncbi:ABC transporter permease subunit [Inconstantimicrobium mannanitabidum]|uniref:Uncharacterized protein n=1 Tax=Inconstantimicrobium mannanitabidum TaxID=1604901 RepID=A0ACB5RGC9_9CLOT|nr:ABC transporter permease subunit [Clostridium sp. TW13]GKX68108.1 hypothetical protein rsdtw13_33660 [Clostridium sp. TW13]